ncbi:Hsp20/alpha crystallin family protein [Paludisphaera sp.]|uniref:Hsp20/alpha crystallin family protein n=1 Tax=Paludisphaera sp. TaxID=2017432 RepID=UPI00301D1213
MSIMVRNRIPAAVNGLGRLDAQMDALMGQLFGEGAEAREQRRGAGPMPMSLWSDEERFHIEVDLPGVRAQDVDVSVLKDALTIKAERAVEEGRNYAYNGRAFGRFERSITLPESVDADSIDASLSNGVLRLSLRKRPEAQVRKIEVRQD